MPEKEIRSFENTIIKTAYSEFLNRGYRKSTITDIAGIAGFTKKDILKQLKSKRNIFKVIFEKEKSYSYNKVHQLFSEVDTGKEKDISTALIEMFKFVSRSRFLEMIYKFRDFPIEICLTDENEPISSQTTLLEKFIKDCQGKGRIRNEAPALIADSFRNLIFIFLQERMYMKNSKRTDELMVEIFVDGLMK